MTPLVRTNFHGRGARGEHKIYWRATNGIALDWGRPHEQHLKKRRKEDRVVQKKEGAVSKEIRPVSENSRRKKERRIHGVETGGEEGKFKSWSASRLGDSGRWTE